MTVILRKVMVLISNSRLFIYRGNIHINNISTNDVHPSKTASLIEVIEFGIVISLIELQPSNTLFPREFTEEGIITFSNDKQSENTLFSIEVTDEGIIISLIIVTELGIITFSKEKQSSKELSQIDVTELGITTSFSDTSKVQTIINYCINLSKFHPSP